MLSSSEQENDVFFDSVDCFENLDREKLLYGIWVKEPVSVKERRENFLREMGRVFFDDVDEVVELDRIRECSDTVSSFSNFDDNSVRGRDVNLEANCMIDELEHDEDKKQNIVSEPQDGFGERADKKKGKKWWKRLVDFKTQETVSRKTSRTKVKQKKKRCMEITALFTRQKIKAHEGSISSMKFSPDGQYLATGGEDGVVCIWRVTSTDVSYELFLTEDDFKSNVNEGKHFDRKKPWSNNASVIFPEKVFHIDDSPVHKFQDHRIDVLDLAWSNSNFLLSCSKDKTVRLWQVGCDHCLHIFHYSNYVTCIEFNPIDENYFISGSIDGKVRIWGVSSKRVLDWADVHDVITAICYHPNGNGFVVGTITGVCRFYEVISGQGGNLELEAEVHVCGKRITGIQFSQEISRRVMISSEDSKLRILDLDSLDVVRKFKGLPKSRSQMSASFTSTEKHIISVGEDNRVYVWNNDDTSSKHAKSVQACEHFFSENVSVAVSVSVRSETQAHDLKKENDLWIRDSDRFSFGSWFSNDVFSKGSATWPEEKLPLWDVIATDQEQEKVHRQIPQSQRPYHNNNMPDSWGLIIVTGGCDGTIRTFHNYGLPVRLQ